jgi:hypothetical protein
MVSPTASLTCMSKRVAPIAIAGARRPLQDVRRIDEVDKQVLDDSGVFGLHQPVAAQKQHGLGRPD